MIVSTRGRYALRVMIDIAEHPNEPYIPLKSIAARQGISEKYLESILKILVQEHFLEGILHLWNRKSAFVKAAKGGENGEASDRKDKKDKSDSGSKD